MGIEARGSGRRGRPKKRWTDCVKDDLREKGLSGEEGTTEPHGGDRRPISTPHRSGIKMKRRNSEIVLGNVRRPL